MDSAACTTAPVVYRALHLTELVAYGIPKLLSRYENFIWIGFLQSGLSLFVGATGPIATSLLLKQSADQNKVIVTAALMMSISHLLKVLVFGWIGFAYLDYLWPLAALIVGAVAGSYLGAKIRPPEPNPAISTG